MQPGRFSAGARKMLLGRLRSALQPFGVLKVRKGRPAGYVSTFWSKLRTDAIEQAGIQFIDDDDLGGFGVRMAKKKRKR